MAVEALTPWSRVAFRVNESAANTLTEATFRTPVSATVRTGMQIRRTELDIPNADIPIILPGTRNTHALDVVLSLRNGLTVLPQPQDPGVIHWMRRREQSAANVVVGAEAAAMATNVVEGVPAIDWASGEAAGGLIIATANLSLYVQGAGNAGAKFGVAQIYYRLIVLTAEELLAAVSLSETF